MKVRLKFNSLDIRFALSGLEVGEPLLLVPPHPHHIVDVDKPSVVSKVIAFKDVSKSRISTHVAFKEAIADWILSVLHDSALPWYRWGVLVSVEQQGKDFEVELRPHA